jgi:hypothetical protein
MQLSSTIAAGAIALALAAPVQAKTLITGVDIPQILEVAQTFGDASLTAQPNGDPQISGEIDGMTYHVIFSNCTDNTDCDDLNFYIGFLDLKPELTTINDWNYAKRFNRAYLDEDGDACAEMDLDLSAGITRKYLEAQFSLWDEVVQQFARHVGYR